MSQSGTIVVRRAETFIPNAYLEKVIKANPHGWGAAIVQETEGKKELLINSGEAEGIEFFQETMKAFDKNDITFYFCNSEAGFNTADVSPYVLVSTKDAEDADVPQVIAFIEGNFPGYAQKGSSHPPEYHLVEEILVPKFENIYDMLEGDLDKMAENFKKPHFKKEMLLTSVSRGTITIVMANGASITFEQNDLSAEYPWGWVSNTHGYTEAEEKKPEVVVEKKKTMFPKRSTVREAAPSAAIAEAVAPPKTETTAVKNYTVKKERPPAHLSRKEKKNWYKSKIGYAPKGWENGVQIDTFVDTNGKLMTFAQVKELGLNGIAVQKMANNPEPEKDTQPEVVTHDVAKPVEKQVTSEVLPIMSPDTRKYINDMMKNADVQKIIAENATRIADPKQIQQLEAKWASFQSQLGRKSIDDFAAWASDFGLVYDLCKSKPDGAAMMIWSLFNERNKLKVQPEVKKEEVAEVKQPEVKRTMFPKRSAA